MDHAADRRYASTVVALMTGFGEAVRRLGMFEGWDFGELVAHYGAIVQAQIDACQVAHPRPSAPNPDPLSLPARISLTLVSHFLSPRCWQVRIWEDGGAGRWRPANNQFGSDRPGMRG